MAMSEKITTICLRVDTREVLRLLGKKGETYDDIIRRLLRKAGHGDLLASPPQPPDEDSETVG
ncbi:MAG: hypothetical protein AB7D01_03225 [Methanoculleus sp.]